LRNRFDEEPKIDELYMPNKGLGEALDNMPQLGDRVANLGDVRIAYFRLLGR
jgi:hypothetical protein